MIRPRAVSLILLCLALTISTVAVAAKKVGAKYVVKQDPQAVAVAKAAFEAMGGADGFLKYQDSVSSGAVVVYSSGDPVSYPITMKSKGLRETRVELQMAKGTNVRIVNQGDGVIVRSDDTVKVLDTNNTFFEHVNHIPLLSVLAEYASGTVNLLYKGVEKVEGQSEDVIEIDFVPTDDPVEGDVFASMSCTLFFVNQSTHMVDKMQHSQFHEGDDKNTVNEEVYLADHQAVSGLLVPFHQTTFIDGKLDSDLKFSTVEFNVGLSDSEFALP